VVQQVQMVSVDLGNDQGHIRRHAVIRSVRENEHTRSSEGGLGSSSRLVRQRAEDGAHAGCSAQHGIGIGRQQRHVPHGPGDLALDDPVSGIGIAFALAAVRGRQRDDLKGGMVVQKLNETSSDGAGGAQDGDWNLVGGHTK